MGTVLVCLGKRSVVRNVPIFGLLGRTVGLVEQRVLTASIVRVVRVLRRVLRAHRFCVWEDVLIRSATRNTVVVVEKPVPMGRFVFLGSVFVQKIRCCVTVVASIFRWISQIAVRVVQLVRAAKSAEVACVWQVAQLRRPQFVAVDARIHKTIVCTVGRVVRPVRWDNVVRLGCASVLMDKLFVMESASISKPMFYTVAPVGRLVLLGSFATKGSALRVVLRTRKPVMGLV